MVNMKEEAIRMMKELKLNYHCINAFKKGVIWYSERQNKIFDGILYELNNDDVKKVIKDIEKDGDKMVYHCQLTHMVDGDMWSILYVTNSEKENALNLKDLSNGQQIAFCFLGSPDYGEYGYIGVAPKNGGITRTY